MCSEVPNQPIEWCVEGDFIREYALKQGEHLELAAFRVFTTWIRVVVSRKVLFQIIGTCLVVKGIAECSPCQNIERGLAIVTNVVNLFRILDNGGHEVNCHVPCANEKSRSQSKDELGMLTVRRMRRGPLTSLSNIKQRSQSIKSPRPLGISIFPILISRWRIPVSKKAASCATTGRF
jgi:hypothetical protein